MIFPKFECLCAMYDMVRREMPRDQLIAALYAIAAKYGLSEDETAAVTAAYVTVVAPLNKAAAEFGVDDISIFQGDINQIEADARIAQARLGDFAQLEFLGPARSDPTILAAALRGGLLEGAVN